MWITIPGVVCAGYGVASGRGLGEPGSGTIALQMPHFSERGLDMTHCFMGTLNVSIAPRRWTMVRPRHVFKEIRWSSDVPAETFSFSPCRIVAEGVRVEGYVYYPHPETKPDHFHPPTVVEIIAPFIEGLVAGSAVELELDENEVALTESG
jgi:hypothetical protein